MKEEGGGPNNWYFMNFFFVDSDFHKFSFDNKEGRFKNLIKNGINIS